MSASSNYFNIKFIKLTNENNVNFNNLFELSIYISYCITISKSNKKEN